MPDRDRPTHPQLGRRDRLALILDRDGARCVWCGQDLCSRLVTPTTEHVVPRVKGGPSWIENEVAACGRCNGERGNRTPVEWATVCQERGWPVAWGTLEASLERLRAAIAQRGGQRRARPYVDSQLRRLRRRRSGRTG